MPRSIWNGTLTFGIVAVPVKLYAATSPKAVRFHKVHRKDLSRIRHRRICEAEDKEVPYEEIVKGYELPSGKFLQLDHDEVKAAAGDRGKVVEIREFVPAADIDPVFIDHSYYVGPREETDAYAVLYRALERTGRAGIGRFSFHNREYLAAVRAHRKVLLLQTLKFHDEIVPMDEFAPEAPDRNPTAKERKTAKALIDGSTEDFDPAAHPDTLRDDVLELAAKKAKNA